MNLDTKAGQEKNNLLGKVGGNRNEKYTSQERFCILCANHTLFLVFGQGDQCVVWSEENTGTTYVMAPQERVCKDRRRSCSG